MMHLDIIPLIKFAPHLSGLSQDQKDMVLNWPPMQRAIKSNNMIFPTDHVQITGTSFAEQSCQTTPLVVSAQVSYKTSKGNDSSYNVNFMPDAASLLVVFRVAASLTTKNPRYKYYALVNSEDRWAQGQPASLQIPAGTLTSNESLNLASIKQGSLREFFEEADSNHILKHRLTLSDIKKLGAPMSLHPANTDKHYAFYQTITLNRRVFQNIKQEMDGKQSGLSAEQEYTRVHILPIQDLYDSLLRSGANPWAHTAVARYMHKEKLITLAR